MSTFEQRRRGILRTALELERDLFAAENRYLTELQSSLTALEAEFAARYARLTAEPRSDGFFDWERSQVESLLREYENQLAYWERQATSTINQGVTDADAMGQEYPANILKAGSSEIDLRHVRPGLNGTQLAAFHSYTAGLVRGVSDKARTDVTGLVRRAALGGDSPLATMQKIGTVTGKGAFATAFHRGEAILRTEMGRAYSSADMIAIRNAAEFNPGLRKRWLSIIDGRVRPEHAAAHDQTKKIDEPFIVGGERLMHPHDTNGSAWNTINCRCKAVPWDPAWDELAKRTGESGELGPLALADTESFQQKLRQLDAMNVDVEQRRSYEEQWGDFDGRVFDAMFTLKDHAENTPWPTPMNPAFWRTKAGFTADQIRELSASARTFAGFLRERYGITLTAPLFNEDDLLKPVMREAIANALERYRSLDPSLVVENVRLRYIGGAESGDLGRTTMGAASFFGDVQFDQALLDAVAGRKRDPNGENAPRLSDDMYLESALHEIAHAISFRYGLPDSMNIGPKILGTDAWAEYDSILFDTRGTDGLREVIEATRKALDDTQAEYASALAAGWRFDDPGMVYRRESIEQLRRSLADQELQVVGFGDSDGYPSRYATQSWAEDFAESTSLMLLQPAEFKLNHPRRYAWFQKWIPKLAGGAE